MKRFCVDGVGVVAPAALVILLGAAIWCRPANAADIPPRELARRLLAEADIKGGLVVHLGCGDGKLPAALHAGESYVVHALDADPANVAKARAYVEWLGLYGKVTVDRWRGDRLPYVDNLVNLLVSTAVTGPRPRATTS